MAELWRIGRCVLRRPHGGAPRDENPKAGQQPHLRRLVAEQLEARRSPQPIAGYLQHTFPAKPTLQVSHETLDQTWSVRTREARKRELTAHFRSGRCECGSRSTPTETRNAIPEAVYIREQAPTVEGRIESGICSSGRGRAYVSPPSSNASARYIVLVKLTRRAADHVMRRLQHQLQHLPAELCSTLIWDWGHAMDADPPYTVTAEIPVCFCDPQRP
jgi:IS30 family transposase